MQRHHIVKVKYQGGKVKATQEMWCGAELSLSSGPFFQDAQHALLSIAQGWSVPTCRECLGAIRDSAEKGMQ